MKALENALQTRQPTSKLLHHSDRGCEYTSAEYRKELTSRGITISMSRKGNCWDNAVAESFISVFYNRQRLHSTLDYRTPQEVEYALSA